MAFLWPDRAEKLTLRALGTLTVADDKDVLISPITGRLVAAHAVIGNTGTTSGNNDFVVENGTTDLWVPAAGVGRIAFNASVPYLDMDQDDFIAAPQINAGDTINLNINAVAGGSPADLYVDLYLIPDGS